MLRFLEAGPALADLLDLMDLGNMWDMDELKRKAEEAIVGLRLVRLETCDDSKQLLTGLGLLLT